MSNPLVDAQDAYDRHRVSRSDQEQAIAGCLDMLGTLVLSPFLLALNGWVLQRLWLWFLEPLGAPEIGILHAAGLFVLIRFVSVKPNDEPLSNSGWVLKTLIIAGIALSVGWILHHFML